MRDLIFIHGRSQEFKNADQLKDEWITAFKRGLSKQGLSLPIPEENIRFPYYGQTLHDLVNDIPDDEIASVIIKGDNAGAEKREFIRQIVLEIQNKFHISEKQLITAGGKAIVEKGPLNWEWLQTVLKVLDERVPGASRTTISLLTNDVYEYLRNPGIQLIIDSGICDAFTSKREQVVVSHSLGTIVAYNILRRYCLENGWKVPLFVTLGSPLAISIIKNSLAPLKHPDCVTHWFNAMDERDIVSLYPLDQIHFGISPPIENKTNVQNHTDNRHGIIGYLDNTEVAKRIHDSLVAPETN